MSMVEALASSHECVRACAGWGEHRPHLVGARHAHPPGGWRAADQSGCFASLADSFVADEIHSSDALTPPLTDVLTHVPTLSPPQ